MLGGPPVERSSRPPVPLAAAEPPDETDMPDRRFTGEDLFADEVQGTPEWERLVPEYGDPDEGR